MKTFSITNLSTSAAEPMEITTPPGNTRPQFVNKDAYRRGARTPTHSIGSYPKSKDCSPESGSASATRPRSFTASRWNTMPS